MQRDYEKMYTASSLYKVSKCQPFLSISDIIVFVKTDNCSFSSLKRAELDVRWWSHTHHTEMDRDSRLRDRERM